MVSGESWRPIIIVNDTHEVSYFLPSDIFFWEVMEKAKAILRRFIFFHRCSLLMTVSGTVEFGGRLVVGGKAGDEITVRTSESYIAHSPICSISFSFCLSLPLSLNPILHLSPLYRLP